MRIIKIIATTIILSGCCITGSILFLTYYPWVDFSVLAYYNPGKASLVLDDAGNELFRFQLDRRDPVSINQIPSTVINAFLAAEDRAFYQHTGISWKGIIRSTLKNLYHRKKVQGASTITQQLVRLLFFDAKKTFTRKIKEQVLAVLIEQQFTKDHILETYLNHIYFGCGIYGVQAAAQCFWNKPVSELSIDEAALLAGIIRLPGTYCPLINPQNALGRRNVVLKCMQNAGYITPEQFQELRQKPIQIAQDNLYQKCAPHLKEMIRITMENIVDKHTLYSGGLTIQTTINSTCQQAAYYTFQKQLQALRTNLHLPIDGGLVCVDTKTGAVKALIGGYNYKNSQFNRATQARRQMGSIFKPLIYAAALVQGAQLTDVEIDEPLSFTQTIGQWQPNNVHKEFSGPMTLAQALIRSNNIIPIKLLLHNGTSVLFQIARQCNIADDLHSHPSLALGCIDITVLQAVGMANIFAHNGIYTEPTVITFVKDAQGKKIWKQSPRTTAPLTPHVSCQIAKVLEKTLNQWRGIVDLFPLSCAAFGKTGTTNDARTCWMIGSTPNYTTALYLGLDDNKAMGKQVYGVTTALPLWLEFNYIIPQPHKQFIYPAGLTEHRINAITGKPADPLDPRAITLLATQS